MYARLASAATVLGFLGLALSGGCVAQSKYDDAVAANTRAQNELEEKARQINALLAERDKLRAQLAAVQPTLDAKDREIAALKASRDDLNKQFLELKRLYDELAGRQLPKVPPGGILLPPAADEALRALAKKFVDIIEYIPEKGMVRFKTDLLFDKGKDDVSARAKDALAAFSQILNDPTIATYDCYIAGHTDDIPIKLEETLRRHPTNWYLSAHRAVAVEEVLVGDNVSPERIGVMGFSEYHPAAANASGNRGNPANRRVEIWIVPPGRFVAGASPASSTEAPAGAAAPAAPAPAAPAELGAE